MNIPIRIKQIKVTNQRRRFDLMRGIEIVGNNLVAIFTKSLVTGGSAWFKSESDGEVVMTDISLQQVNYSDASTGEWRFDDTPEGVATYTAALEITQTI